VLVLRRVIAWFTVTGLAAALMTGALAWHEGYRAYAIKTGSMTPTYPTGALVIDRPSASSAPNVGQVITFRTKDGLVTHRIHALKDGGYETKGDANRTPDVGTVPFQDVIGVVAWGAAYLGYVFVFFQQPTGALSLMLLALSVYLAWAAFFPAEDDEPELAEGVHDGVAQPNPNIIVLPDATPVGVSSGQPAACTPASSPLRSSERLSA
jgi:signal peptidase